jgi:uncharacterized membrane protein YesL
VEENKSVNFWKGINLAGTAIMINLAFLLCCIPVVTIGPAICGLYSSIRYVVRGNGWFNGFSAGIKKNFVRNALVGSLLLIMIVDLAISFNTALGFYLESSDYTPLIIYAVGLLPVVMVFSALWPLHVFIPYESGSDWLKDCLKLLVKAPIQLILVSALMLLPVALILYIPEIGFMLMIVFLAIYYALMGFASILLLKNPLEQRLGAYRAAHPQAEE